ncbi:MAG: peptidylprolyl isomerase [Cloacibacillus sp.]
MSIRKKLVVSIAVVVSVSAFAAASFAAAPAATTAPKEAPVVIVGEATLAPNEVIAVLQNTAGGNPMLVGMMLQQSTLKERAEMAAQMADAMLFAEGAKLSGLAEREDLKFKLKWQHTQSLVEAYLQEISKKWDMGEKAMKKYYETHKTEFVQAAGTHVRHILTSTEKDAKDVLLDIAKNNDFEKTAEKYSRDTNTAARGGDLGWVEKGVLPAPLDKEIDAAKKNEIVGPVKTELGWHVLQVLDRRPSKQLTFEEAKDEIVQRLQMSYVAKELEALKKKIKVEIKEEGLSNLGGIPAATPEADKKFEKGTIN